ncbi:MAG: hypothetical protein QGD94_09670 [Planctomycetia bacterium]|nr:hypothetical protein [Planctomycetia bacterium]
MSNKKAVLTLSVFVILVLVLAALYFTYWREPEARYVATSNPKLIQIRKDLNALKADLREKGLYACCIRNDCNWCALYMGHCPCAKLLLKDGEEKSCPECAAAWNRKQGRIPGVDADAIKVTTFGIYGMEEGGHHHPESAGGDTEEETEGAHEHEEEQHH